MRIRGKTNDEACDRQQALLLAERQWISEEQTRIQGKLTDLKEKSATLVVLDQLRKRIAGKILSNSFADRRFVLEALQTKVVVTEDSATEVEFTIGGDKNDGGLALNLPLNACP